MNRYHPIAAPDTDLTINGTTIRHLYDADRIWVHNTDIAEAIGALAKGSLLTGVSAKWKRKWREDLAPFTPATLRNANLGKRQRQVRERMSQIQHLLDLMAEDLVDAAIEKDITL